MNLAECSRQVSSPRGMAGQPTAVLSSIQIRVITRGGWGDSCLIELFFLPIPCISQTHAPRAWAGEGGMCPSSSSDHVSSAVAWFALSTYVQQ